MKAIVYRGFGPPDVLKLEEIEKPVPKDDEVLIKIRAAALNPLDWRLMRGGPLPIRVLFWLSSPKVKRPGVDVAGEVEAIGKNVTRFKAGDAAFGTCDGACAEYACAVESKLAKKPNPLAFEQAASIPVAGITALQGLRDKGQLQPGQKVLINGAAGGVGTFAVQIANWLGAHVTGVCSTRNVDMVRSLGADQVIDYTREDFTTSAERYDLILDNIGNHTLSAMRRVLSPQGRCVIAGGPKEMGSILIRIAWAPVFSWFVSQRFGFLFAKIDPKDLSIIAELIAAGKLKPVIDRCCRLSDVPQAIGYLEQGHARGKVIVSGTEFVITTQTASNSSVAR